MPTYFTKQDATVAAGRARQRGHFYNSRQALNNAVLRASHTDQYDIFLSHSSRDADLILGVKQLLEDQQLRVYVDWLDDAQLSRENVNRDTAKILRQRMKQSSSLVWVATESASSSRWMPWELGFFDGHKTGQVAILPLVDNTWDVFQGQEYLSLYPLIRKNQNPAGREQIYVEDPGYLWTTLDRFGSGNTQWYTY